MKKEQADRYNENKLSWHNFPMFLLRPLIKVSAYGAKKYSTFNYLKGAPISQYMDCMKRHMDDFEDTTMDDLDPGSRVNHLAHVAWNALVAIHVLEKHGDVFDDRYKEDDE